MTITRQKHKKYYMHKYGHYTSYSYVVEVDGREMEFVSYEEYLEYMEADDENYS